MSTNPTVALDRLRAAHRKVAALTVANPALAPVFERLEREIVEREALEGPGGLLERARAAAAA